MTQLFVICGFLALIAMLQLALIVQRDLNSFGVDPGWTLFWLLACWPIGLIMWKRRRRDAREALGGASNPGDWRHS